MNKITKIIYKNGKYLDQIAKKQIWINAHKMKYYLRDTYGLTITQYCSLIDYGDKDFIPKCPICNKNYLYVDRLRLGFTNTCSHSCNAKYVANKLISEGKHNFQKENLTEDLKKLHVKTMTSFEFRCKASLSSSIKKAKYKKAYLYISEVIDDKYHIHLGITKDWKTRDNSKVTKSSKHYFNNIKPLFLGETKAMFELEYLLKLKFANRYFYKKYNKTEIYNTKDKKQIFKFLAKYVKESSTTIEKVI